VFAGAGDTVTVEGPLELHNTVTFGNGDGDSITMDGRGGGDTIMLGNGNNDTVSKRVHALAL
jgi:hypothetical protein